MTAKVKKLEVKAWLRTDLATKVLYVMQGNEHNLVVSIFSFAQREPEKKNVV